MLAQHIASEDIACLRSIANIEVISPSDDQSTKDIVNLCLNKPKLRFVRLERAQLENIYNNIVIKENNSYSIINDKGNSV